MCSITSCWKGFKLKNFLRFARTPVTKRQRAWMLKKLWMQFLAHTSASGWTTLFRTITGFSTPGPLQRLCFRTDACAGFTGSERFRRVKAGLQADKHSDGVWDYPPKTRSPLTTSCEKEWWPLIRTRTAGSTTGWSLRSGRSSIFFCCLSNPTSPAPVIRKNTLTLASSKWASRWRAHPTKKYINGMEAQHMWQEISRYFQPKDVESKMYLTRFYPIKFGLFIDIRSMLDTTVHGNGVRLVNTKDRVFLEIYRKKSGSRNMNCHALTVSDAQMNIMDKQL